MTRTRWMVTLAAVLVVGCDSGDGSGGSPGGGDAAGDSTVADVTGADGGGDGTTGADGSSDGASGPDGSSDDASGPDGGADATDGGGASDADAASDTGGQTLEECLAECGTVGCTAAAELCGEDGSFGCPCDMACRGIAAAADPQSCCEPVPSNCVATCQENVAMTCTSSVDPHGCVELVWTDTACGADTCVVSYDTGTVSCVAGAEALCTGTSGVWSADGYCDCPTGQTFAAQGCQSDDLTACLLACGDGCFAPAQEVCAADGSFGCECELACYGIPVAEDPTSCCEPIPPGCVATCNDGVASSCIASLDEHGCPAQDFSTVGCGGMACLASSPSAQARCVDPCLPMDAALGTGECDTFWGYTWDGAGCEYLGGTCTCDGADCYALYESEESCVAVHGVCDATPDPQAVCEATAGSFAEGACNCGEGGAFAPAFGCYPASANACVGSGGQWLAAFCGPYCGDCKCPGASTFDPASGCVGG